MVKMNRKIKLIAALLSAIFFCITSAFAVNIPAMKGRVNDYAKIIRDSDEHEIEEYLYNLEQSTGIQLAVLTMPSLEGDDIASFGIKLADKWQLGDKDKDNGAILIVAYEEHDLRIEVGDGLEGSLTDAKCGLILRNVIVPEFKNGNYSAGIKKGIMNMGGIASGDESAVSRSVREGQSSGNSSNDSIIPLFICLIWLLLFVSSIAAGTRRGRRRGRYYHNGNTIAWIAADAALRSMMRSSGGSSSHSSSLGGSHSGGFGGFSGGGGHFSGGGASAHW